LEERDARIAALEADLAKERAEAASGAKGEVARHGSESGSVRTRLQRAELAESSLRSELKAARDSVSKHEANLLYAKNVVVQYLGLEEGSRERLQLASVLQAVLRFDEDDMAAIAGKARLSLAGGAASIFGVNIGRGGVARPPLR
jgi:hypothetical protein